MAELRYNINHSWRWSSGQCYTIVEYSVSYNPVKNESTVTFNRTRTRLWGHGGTSSEGTVSLTVRANDSGATASATSYPGDHFWNDGFTVFDEVVSPSSITVKHSDVAGAKSITLSSTTGFSHWQNEYTSGSGSVTITTGERKGYYAIDDGSKILQCIPYIDDGSKWVECIPYVDNGSNWVSGS